jgi:hypothetical protein
VYYFGFVNVGILIVIVASLGPTLLGSTAHNSKPLRDTENVSRTTYVLLVRQGSVHGKQAVRVARTGQIRRAHLILRTGILQQHFIGNDVDSVVLHVTSRHHVITVIIILIMTLICIYCA